MPDISIRTTVIINQNKVEIRPEVNQYLFIEASKALVHLKCYEDHLRSILLYPEKEDQNGLSILIRITMIDDLFDHLQILDQAEMQFIRQFCVEVRCDWPGQIEQKIVEEANEMVLDRIDRHQYYLEQVKDRANLFVASEKTKGNELRCSTCGYMRILDAQGNSTCERCGPAEEEVVPENCCSQCGMPLAEKAGGENICHSCKVAEIPDQVH